jgi:glyoxylase-like metal-dependent hydrolase (beta-lactamase superfamily II)
VTARTIEPGTVPPIRTVDTHQFDLPRRGAAYVVGIGRTGLVETGTPRAAPFLLDALADEDLAFIFVTHVHLDHAGAAGALAARYPNAAVVAHPRAIRHLADPRRLVDAVREASPELFPLYGDPTPIPGAQLRAADDGERFDLGGGVVIEAIHAPGHAPHHVCFIERSSRTLFAGDAAGNHGIAVDVPLTVPPRFDLDGALSTLDRLRRLRPSSIAYTHFGRTEEDPDALLVAYRRSVIDWFDRIRRLRGEQGADGVVAAVLADPKYGELEPPDRFSIEMCVRGALLTLEATAP